MALINSSTHMDADTTLELNTSDSFADGPWTAAAADPSGAGAQTLPALTMAGVGLMQPSGVGSQNLAALAQSGVGIMQPSGAGAQILAALAQAGVGVEIFAGAGVQTLAALIQNGAGTAGAPEGAGAQALAALVQAGVGLMLPSGAGAQTLFALIQAGSGTLEVSFTSANLALNHSGASDIGGAIGAVLTDDVLNNLWDDVSSGDASAGDTEYRCTYVKNTHGSLSVANVRVKVATDPAESDWEIGLGAAGKNGTETEVANEDTAPGGVSFGLWSISLGTLAAGDFYPIWVKRIVSAGAGAATPDSGVLNILGDDPN